MAKVYFIKCSGIEDAAAAAEKLLGHIIESENVVLEKHLPLKVHFGEKGNTTYLPAETYSKINGFLEKQGISTAYYETSVLYGGERFKAEKHIALARKHGFTDRDIVIADGKSGEDAVQVDMQLKHFASCAVARKLAEASQVLVLSHFKGHMLAGFGGAIKQLGMGFAAKGGKMAMHLGVKPRVISFLCRGCGACVRRCNENAIEPNGKKFRINHDKCIGCGACFSICPAHAVSVWSFAGLANALFKGRFFREKLVEYAFAGHKGKKISTSTLRSTSPVAVTVNRIRCVKSAGILECSALLILLQQTAPVLMLSKSGKSNSKVSNSSIMQSVSAWAAMSMNW